ncbi:Lrp/AsnC family transcriptional regulator [Pseudoduganella sp. UC29_106]|uniref:Lrp/AsnC family transcriptional regulator n=1 Tax=Pseudoduganella sp. UC29_106 TaxID=3374553 RepID=UPI0037569F61
MDKKDLEILSLLQEDASAPLATLAEAINLSSTPCWRRIQKLQEDGVIQRQVALCDPEQLNLGLTAFVAVRTNLHNREWTERFVSGARDIPEIIEIYRMSGDIDYMLKVMVPDIRGYDEVYKKLIKVVDLFDVSSSFAMEVVKHTTALPLHYAHIKG